jgi:hypothetical protein
MKGRRDTTESCDRNKEGEAHVQAHSKELDM